jgi:hypothetical protein
MHRKTHSESTPHLGRELKREFAGSFRRIEISFRWYIRNHRIPAYTAMLICILLSALLAFTVMRVEKTGPLPSIAKSTGKAESGFSQIVETGQALQQVLDLQSQINAVLQKDNLTALDSAAVKDALKKLEAIQHQINPKPNKK